MYLVFFDENKHSKESPNFLIGGYIVPEKEAIDLDKSLIDSNFLL